MQTCCQPWYPAIGQGAHDGHGLSDSQRQPQATARTGHRPRWDWEENAWWALYRKEMPEEDYGTFSRTQKASRRRRFLKALAAEQESGKPACETGGDVSDEPVRRD